MGKKEGGLAPLLLILLAGFGLIAYFIISSSASFKDALFSKLYPKKSSYAANFEAGFNIPGISHYGFGDVLPYSQSSNVDADLAEMKKMGATVVRVSAANKYISAAEASQRLDAFLTKAETYGISAIVYFAGLIKDSAGLYPAGMEPYFTNTWKGMYLLNHDFFATGYKTSYLPYIQTVVSANKHHANIYSWEIGNELKDDSSPTTLINFMNDVSSSIKSWDPTHAVSTGMINAGHAGLTPSGLYSQLPYVDIITIHAYDGDRGGLVDVQWAKNNNKTVILEEFGFGGTGDRTSKFKNEVDYWKGQGVAGVLQWGFIAKGLSDNGDGDRNYGMDAIWHTDYDQLASLYQIYTSSNPEPTVTPNTATACDPSQLNMVVSPNPGIVGSSMDFSLSGSQGSTFVEDAWSGGVNCTGGFWGSKTCTAASSGSFTWTHKWKNCAPNDCSITSAQCSKTAQYQVNNSTLSGTISGSVFLDMNRNKIKDISEAGYTASLVNICITPGAKCIVTDSNGNFTFGNLNKGSYTLRFSPPKGYKLTTNNSRKTLTVPPSQVINYGLIPF